LLVGSATTSTRLTKHARHSAFSLFITVVSHFTAYFPATTKYSISVYNIYIDNFGFTHVLLQPAAIAPDCIFDFDDCYYFELIVESIIDACSV
jgi:hypothetical protein